jgi:DNA anti-recombination protein RmuC
MPSDLRTTKPVVETPKASPTPTRAPEAQSSKKIARTVEEETDPAKALAEIRRVLMEPTRQLHEARMEELIVILEESDRESQKALQKMDAQFASLADDTDQQVMGIKEANLQIENRTKKLNLDLLETNKKIDDQSENMFSELQRVAKHNEHMLAEMKVMFEARLEKLSAQMSKQMEDMANHSSTTLQTLVAEFNMRLQDLTKYTTENDKNIADQVEARFSAAEAKRVEEKRRNIAALTAGFTDLSDRILALQSA